MVEQVGGALDCCGMGGSLGYKKSFHNASLKLAMPLIKKIQAAGPQAIVTECLSCRLQFRHVLPYPVYHPAEILSLAYEQASQRQEPFAAQVLVGPHQWSLFAPL